MPACEIVSQTRMEEVNLGTKIIFDCTAWEEKAAISEDDTRAEWNEEEKRIGFGLFKHVLLVSLRCFQ